MLLVINLPKALDFRRGGTPVFLTSGLAVVKWWKLIFSIQKVILGTSATIELLG